MKPTFDAYQELMDLKRFAHNADAHIHSLLKNQEQLIKAINNQSEQLTRLENTVKFYKKILKEIRPDETTGSQ